MCLEYHIYIYICMCLEYWCGYAVHSLRSVAVAMVFSCLVVSVGKMSLDKRVRSNGLDLGCNLQDILWPINCHMLQSVTSSLGWVHIQHGDKASFLVYRLSMLIPRHVVLADWFHEFFWTWNSWRCARRGEASCFHHWRCRKWTTFQRTLLSSAADIDTNCFLGSNDITVEQSSKSLSHSMESWLVYRDSSTNKGFEHCSLENINSCHHLNPHPFQPGVTWAPQRRHHLVQKLPGGVGHLGDTWKPSCGRVKLWVFPHHGCLLFSLSVSLYLYTYNLIYT